MIASRRNAHRFIPAWTALSVVALLGLGQTARAEVISFEANVTLSALNVESHNLDVDRNGTVDFVFTAALVLDPVVSVGFGVVDFPFGGRNGVVVDRSTADGFPTASLLRVGDTVSDANTFSSASFDQANLFFFTSFDPPSGNFGGRTGYLGLRFDRAGGTAFGFAQVTINDLDAPVNPLGLTIGTVGYNDVTGQPAQITAVPAPAGLPLFAAGGLVLLAAGRWRRGIHAPAA